MTDLSPRDPSRLLFGLAFYFCIQFDYISNFETVGRPNTIWPRANQVIVIGLNMNLKTSLLAALAFLLSMPLQLQAVQEDQSSRRETEIVKKVEAAGGRVYRISAADTSKEISFNLSSTPVTDDHLKDINSIGEVIWLNLAGTKITDEGLKHLEGMPLKKLHLERTAIGDSGIAHLQSFKELEYLNIYDTKVSNNGIKHLRKLKGLKKLYVWKSQINETGIERLRKALPQTEIVGALKLNPVVVEEPKKKEMKKKEPKKDDKAKEAKKKEKEAKAEKEKPKKKEAEKKQPEKDKAKGSAK